MPRGIRNPVSENQKVTTKNIRKGAGRQMKLDASIYAERHRDKKLMWITDSGTDLDWWLQQEGVELVERASVERKVFEGVNDKHTSKYVTVPTGKQANGNVELSYLLMIDPGIYEELVVIPKQERQAEIAAALRLGHDQSGLERHLKGGGQIQTYAPNLPFGDGQGYNEIRRQG